MRTNFDSAVGLNTKINLVGTGLLRFGHATALTVHWTVIHYRVAASLRPRRSVYGKFD